MDSHSVSGGQLRDKVPSSQAGTRFGEAICHEFARQGAVVGILDINGAGAAEVAEGIDGFGGSAFALEADVADYQKVAEATGRTLQERGTVDILVNCAGTNHFSLPNEYTTEDWERLLSVNLSGQWHCCRAVMPEMMKRRSGKILNIGFGGFCAGYSQAAPYSIAKHGVVGLTRALAVDLGPYNINVNCLCPATVDTPLLREATNQAFVDGMIKSIPMGRLGERSDIAQAALS